MKKKIVVGASLLLAIVMLVGATYAFFSYTRESDKNSKLITGEIYMHYNESVDSINLIDCLPQTAVAARGKDDNFITFTIDGVNTTTNKDIYYEIILSDGNNIDGKTRLNDSHLRFDLTETKIENGVEVSNDVLTDVSYDDISNKRIWVGTINRNTTEEVVVTYKLRMWISDEVLISDTVDADYTTVQFKDAFASVRVSVNGDFTVKQVD